MRARVIRAKVVLILVVLGLALAVTASPVAAGSGSVVVGTPEGEIGGGVLRDDRFGSVERAPRRHLLDGPVGGRELQLRFQHRL